MVSSNRLKALDFFCGGGGMTYGLQQSGIDVLAGIDFDPSAKDTYESNNPKSKFILADVLELDVEYFEKQFNINRNDDYLILVGCSPCQYYSIINTDKRNSFGSKDLLMAFAKFIKYYNPGFVLVENVPGIKTNKNSILPAFLDFLNQQGYAICDDVIDLSYYGIPQTRKRYSLIASRVSHNISLPIKNSKRSVLKDFIGVEKGFPVIGAGHKDSSIFNHTTAGLSDINLERLALTPKNGGNRLAWKDYKHLQLKCFVDKDKSFVDTFGRMHWDRPASTITTKFFSISNGRFAHPDEDRALSIREGATLQTFPKNYIFKTTSIANTAKLIGNAVPPKYAQQLGEVIIERVSTWHNSKQEREP